MRELITRAQAKAAGLKTYFTGAPCNRGEIAERRTNGGACLCSLCRAECVKRMLRYKSENAEKVRSYQAIHGREYAAKNKEKIKATNRAYHLKNRESRISAMRGYYAKNREKMLAASGDYYRKNKASISIMQRAWARRNRDKVRGYTRAWTAKNRERVNAYVSGWWNQRRDQLRAKWSKRRAAERMATPIWLTAEHASQNGNVYSQAVALEAETGTPHHVDHAIPLRGKLVCGLHVPWNLQVITAADNLAKSNKLIA